jgi:hypothetical protein
MAWLRRLRFWPCFCGAAFCFGGKEEKASERGQFIFGRGYSRVHSQRGGSAEKNKEETKWPAMGLCRDGKEMPTWLVACLHAGLRYGLLDL